MASLDSHGQGSSADRTKSLLEVARRHVTASRAVVAGVLLATAGLSQLPASSPNASRGAITRTNADAGRQNARQQSAIANRESVKNDQEFADLNNEQLKDRVKNSFGEIAGDLNDFHTKLAEYSGSQLSSINAELPALEQGQQRYSMAPVEFLTFEVKAAIDSGDREASRLALAHSRTLRRHHSNQAAEVMDYQDPMTKKSDTQLQLQSDINHALTELEDAEYVIQELIRRGVDKDHMARTLQIVQQRTQALEALEANMRRRWGQYRSEAER